MRERDEELLETMERLIEAVEILEATMENASATPAVSASAEEIAEKIVATVETQREAELERKLAQAEAKIAQLEASAVSEKSTGRKTLPNAMSSLLAKQGVAVDGLEAGALDAALTSLSIEQRIAVKAELLRTGMLG